MNNTECTVLLEKALDFIVEIEESGDFICENLHNIGGEFDFCSKNCENLTKKCVLRYLRYYEKTDRKQFLEDYFKIKFKD